MSRHTAMIDWILDPVTSDADYLAGHYSRAHQIFFDGEIGIAGSASPSVVRAPWSRVDAVDPEELLVASAASCHMLWFLDFAKREGLVVRSYQDAPEGRMGRMADGSIGIAEITLNPVAHFGGVNLTTEALAALHQKAHSACNVANSLKSEIHVKSVDRSVKG